MKRFVVVLVLLFALFGAGGFSDGGAGDRAEAAVAPMVVEPDPGGSAPCAWYQYGQVRTIWWGPPNWWADQRCDYVPFVGYRWTLLRVYQR